MTRMMARVMVSEKSTPNSHFLRIDLSMSIIIIIYMQIKQPIVDHKFVRDDIY